MTKYLVVQIGWEYNDEYYHRCREAEGTAELVYNSKELAEEKANSLTIHRELRVSDPEQIFLFFRDPTCPDAEKEYWDRLTDIFGDKTKVSPDTLFKQATDAEMHMLCEYLSEEGVIFYKVREIQEGD